MIVVSDFFYSLNDSTMKKFCMLFLTLLLLPVVGLFSQTIVEEKPTVPPEYMVPGFHFFSHDDIPFSIRQNSGDYDDIPYSHNLSDCIVDEYVSTNYSYNGVNNLPYMMLPPESVATGELYPLVIDAHGAGGIGTDPTDLTGVNQRLAQDTMRALFPCYAVSARVQERVAENEDVNFCHPIYGYRCELAYPIKTPIIDIYIEMIEDLIARYPIDPNRIYVTGHSHGGHTTRLLITERPDLFAAASPGSASPILFMNHPSIVADNVPIWQMGAVNDATVAQHGLESSYDSLLLYGALDNIFWLTKEGSHSHEAPHRRELIDWMFKQNKQDQELRPLADFSVNTTEGFPSLTVSFDGSASAATGGASINSYEWQIATSLRGLDSSSLTYSGTTGSHTFSDYGTYYLRLIVTDNNGRRRAKVERITVHNPNPVASFLFDKNYDVPQATITFDASESVPVHGETISSYAWDFGDGATASGKEVTHAYSDEGTYTCRLTVTSSGGNTDVLEYEVNVAADFPGYQYFTYIGTEFDPIHLWRGGQGMHEIRWMVGTDPHPKTPMVENDSSGMSATANSKPDRAYRAFDQDEETGWSIMPHILPGILTMDLGYKIIPTGMHYLPQPDQRREFKDFYILASVDSLMWDTLYHHLGDSGVVPDIRFPGMTYIEVRSPLIGEQFGQGTDVSLQAEVFNVEEPNEVRYYVNGTYVGSSTTAPDFDVNWTADLPVGMHQLEAQVIFHSTNDTVTSPVIDIEVLTPPMLSSIEISPEGIALLPGQSQAYHAIALDQYGQLLDPQPEFTWYIIPEAGSVSPEGLFTAGSLPGQFEVLASASQGASSVTSRIEVVVDDTTNLCSDYFAGSSFSSSIWRTVDLDLWSGSSVEVDSGKLMLTASGEGYWETRNEYYGLIRDDITGNFDLSVKVLSQSYVDGDPKAGIIIANNFDNLSEGGYAMVFAHQSGRIQFRREGGTPGQITSSYGSYRPDGPTYPVWLRLKKAGTMLYGYYKYHEDSAWIALEGGTEVALLAENSQVGLHTFSGDAGVASTATFSAFANADCVEPEVSIVAPVDNAVYQEGTSVSIQSELGNVDPGSIDKLVYYANGDLLGEGAQDAPYSYLWEGVAPGSYHINAVLIYNSLQDTIVSAGVLVSIEELPVFSSLSVVPQDAYVSQGDSLVFTALALNQYAESLDPQPTITWSVSGGGTIDQQGVFTAGNESGEFYVYAGASVESVSIQDTISVIVYSGQFITFDPIADKFTTDAPFTISAMASSGLPVSFEILSGPATLSGDEVTLTGETGVVEIEATQTGNAEFDPAEPVVRTFRVTLVSEAGLVESENGLIHLYPNPAREVVTVRASSVIECIQLNSLQGIELKYQTVGRKLLEIDLSGFPVGVYLLQVHLENGEHAVRRLIIE
jgi:PKD repeat protein